MPTRRRRNQPGLVTVTGPGLTGISSASAAAALQAHRMRGIDLSPVGRPAIRSPAKGNVHARSRPRPKRATEPRAGTTGAAGRPTEVVGWLEKLPRERVLRPPPPPTLAEKLGLVQIEGPGPVALTADGWDQVKHRSALREDSKAACSICREPFGLGQQVLLSCSHVFHRACIAAFERHTGAARRTCPLCRHRDYQTRLINDGAREHLHRSATVIQAAYRGHRARVALAPMLEAHVPADPGLRKRWQANRLAAVTGAIVNRANARAGEVDRFLAELDATVSASKATIAQAQAKVMARPLPETEWARVAATAGPRLTGECAICLTGLAPTLLRGRARTLLSCSHVFHAPCISALESFSCVAIPVCPICRAPYHKKELSPAAEG